MGTVFLFLNFWVNKVCNVVEQALGVTLSLLYKANLLFREQSVNAMEQSLSCSVQHKAAAKTHDLEHQTIAEVFPVNADVQLKCLCLQTLKDIRVTCHSGTKDVWCSVHMQSQEFVEFKIVFQEINIPQKGCNIPIVTNSLYIYDVYDCTSLLLLLKFIVASLEGMLRLQLFQASLTLSFR